MGIKENLMVKMVRGTGDFSLTAKADESLKILDVRVLSGAQDKYVTLTVEKAVVGFFRVSGRVGGHLPLPYNMGQHSHNVFLTGTDMSSPSYEHADDAMAGDPQTLGFVHEGDASAGMIYNMLEYANSHNVPSTILGYLRNRELFDGYPVASGETFRISGVAHANDLVLIIYEVHDKGDMLPEMPNGSKSSEYIFLNYGRPSADITGVAETLFDTIQSSAEFPDFPFIGVAPSNKIITLHGILATVTKRFATAANTIQTTFLKMVRERDTLFDDDKNGLPFLAYGGFSSASYIFGEGYSMVGGYTPTDSREPFMFPEPLVFESGAEFDTYVKTEINGAGATLEKAKVEMAYITSVVEGG